MWLEAKTTALKLRSLGTSLEKTTIRGKRRRQEERTAKREADRLRERHRRGDRGCRGHTDSGHRSPRPPVAGGMMGTGLTRRRPGRPGAALGFLPQHVQPGVTGSTAPADTTRFDSAPRRAFRRRVESAPPPVEHTLTHTGRKFASHSAGPPNG